MTQWFRLVCLLVPFAVALMSPANAQEVRALNTNQHYIEQASKTHSLDVTDTESVFRFVFGALPESVTVYPTENYYYFSFLHDGAEFAGNLRLDASDRDKGIIHFAYFSAYAQWNQEIVSQYKPLTADDGVRVEKLHDLAYKITFEDKSVTFNLNDLTDTRPPPGSLRKNEEYLGPVFDESGIEMYLVFNTSLKIFHYLLNDAGAAREVLNPSGVSDHIWIGHRTGFAYYADRLLNRKILIGVYNGNSEVNNYFDGPFDQLPDNFIRGNALKDALEAAFPSIKGKIDRYGNAEGGQTRILVTPYIHYDSPYELQYFSECADTASEDEDAYYRCFSVEEDDDAEAADASADESTDTPSQDTSVTGD